MGLIEEITDAITETRKDYSYTRSVNYKYKAEQELTNNKDLTQKSKSVIIYIVLEKNCYNLNIWKLH